MFDGMYAEQKDSTARNKYRKMLGFYEFDKDGNRIEVCVIVYDTSIGYSVFRQGEELRHIMWSKSQEEAVEYGVMLAKEEIKAHEEKK